NSTIDTLYTSNKRMPACLYSFDNQSIFFFEEYEDKAIDSKSYERDYYRTYLKRISINSLEINELADNSSNNKSYCAKSSSNYIVYKMYPTGFVNALDLNSFILKEVNDGQISYFDLADNNYIYYSDCQAVIDCSFIKRISLDSDSIDILCNNAIAPSLNESQTKVCYISRYITNPKSKNYLTN
ncbi:MAG: hypothetical protein PWQ09_1569, partial [Candidatus Cloacimonadota bacterium]|nr:hypothetical protein [Candidatus Cloacimonadota bacterium]